MNIFFIPSWYPSVNQKLPGIFFREQAIALTKMYPDITIGISTWGQNDDRMLLWARQPFASFKKVITNYQKKPTHLRIKTNLVEYNTPRFTWSSRFLGGNIEGIIRANELNLARYSSEFGKPDLIHAHVSYPAGHIAQKISGATGIPYVITEQMSPFPHRNFVSGDGGLIAVLQNAYSGSSANIAISSSLAEKMNSFSIGNLHTIPNLVDESLFMPSPRTPSNEVFTFFLLGRMVHQKGIDILLKAFADIEGKAVLRIGGDGEERESYQKLASELGIERKVTWLGELDQQQAIQEFQRCDAFVLPSRHESMGVVFIEAMACGKPVIGTISGGPEEFINESNGILVPTEDAASLRCAMDEMISNVDKYDPKKIRQMVLSRFSSDAVCKQIRRIYQHMIVSSSRN